MAFKQNKVNRDLVLPPVIMFTDRALSQLKLIIENDFTLAGKYFRIVVSGKGCEGFTYAAGFTDLNEDDFQVRIANTEDEIYVLVDPFAAFYLQEASVDFVQDFEQDAEGFVIVNHAQGEFKGKFWRAAPEKAPPIKEGAPDA
ncbi:MAG: iron-sulfur cluster assembly accessory protein [Bacteriovorax sp.]|nr:iron-sulfur cluster assembly accessory protein [Bacteriovorax sp.]